MVNVAIMGHGVVGSGVAEILMESADSIEKKAKERINVKYILDLRDFNELSYSDKFIKDFNIILNDESVRVVAEAMGGINPAYDFVKACLLAGKSVVTSNKELVASKGAELLRIAEDMNVNFLFEASVGGGIPVLRPIAQCLAANELYEITGILNGTTNFIMTKMVRDNMEFGDALTLAQKLGYAEKDPTADIEGIDAGRKICILAALAFGKHVYPDTVYTEGISKITQADIAYANAADSVIKLIGRARLLDKDHCIATVYPAFVSKKDPLALVDDVFNAIKIKGNYIGDVMFYGRGAGKMPTASAVCADIIDCVKHLKARKYLSWDDADSSYVADHSNDTVRMFFRIQSDSPEELHKEIINRFGDVKFLSIAGADSKELAFITAFAAEKNIEKIIGELENMRVLSKIRVLN